MLATKRIHLCKSRGEWLFLFDGASKASEKIDEIKLIIDLYLWFYQKYMFTFEESVYLLINYLYDNDNRQDFN